MFGFEPATEFGEFIGAVIVAESIFVADMN